MSRDTVFDIKRLFKLHQYQHQPISNMAFTTRVAVALLLIILLIELKSFHSVLTTETNQIKSNLHSEENIKLLNNILQEPTSKFDNISMGMYKRATQIEAHSNRKNFTLMGWERGSGGLDDDDRELLGKIYLNATSVFEFGLGK